MMVKIGNNNYFDNRSNQRNGIVALLFIIVSVILISIVFLRPVGFDHDSLTYETVVNETLNGQYQIKEPTFIFFAWLSELLFDKNIHSVFFMYAFIAISVKMTAIYKYSEIPLMSLVIYLCMYFILHELTQIRVGAAAAFFMLAIPDLIEKRKKSYLIKIGIACLFHFSCIILFPLILLSSRRINTKLYFLMPFCALAMTLAIGNMDAILISLFSLFPAPFGPKAVGYIINLQLYGRFDNVNIFSKFTLCVFCFFIIYATALARSSILRKADIIYFKIISTMLSSFYILSSVPVLASRTFELFGVILIFALPAMSLRIRQKYFVGSIVIFWSVLYLYIVNIKLLNFDIL